MSLPFTTEQFLEVFRQYNTSIWPMQVVLTVIALGAVALAASGRNGRVVGMLLAAEWAWTGVVYHWAFFARINPAARFFGVLWLAGAAAFAVNALGRRAVAFRSPQPWRLAIGGSLIVYAFIVYPALGYLGGRVYPFAPTYGAPCPVTIATLGVLWLAKPPLPRHLVIGPVIWAAIGSVAAFSLGVREDLGLLAAGLSGVLLLVLPHSPEPAVSRTPA